MYCEIKTRISQTWFIFSKTKKKKKKLTKTQCFEEVYDFMPGRIHYSGGPHEARGLDSLALVSRPLDHQLRIDLRAFSHICTLYKRSCNSVLIKISFFFCLNVEKNAWFFNILRLDFNTGDNSETEGRRNFVLIQKIFFFFILRKQLDLDLTNFRIFRWTINFF